MKIALVHDLLTQMGGAERVLAVLHQMYPDAPIYTLASNPGKMMEELKDADIRTTWLQRIPGIETNFKKLLPLYPIALQQLELSEFDVVISSSFAFVKGIKVPPSTFHFCYCHTPMRFAWDFESYIARETYSPLVKKTLRSYVKYLKNWDMKTADRVDEYVANSNVVRQRIKSCYGIDAQVIFPPVNTERFSISNQVEDYYLVVSRLVPYKRIDLVVEAFNRNGQKLLIVGGGPDLGRLKSMANPNIQFLGRLEDNEVSRLMSRCRAFIFPGEEDFGITPLEVNAAGRPVIAYKAGGALDTISHGTNGLFFDRQTPDSLIQAVRDNESNEWNPVAIKEHAEAFNEERFKHEFHNRMLRAKERFDIGLVRKLTV
ncbi:glycosyltransferase [Paenibacillus validus]|uniref:glycosyltransferase n=2 Tax=Paenibacillus validus TaxID=44253 RepID=UPI000FDCB083|nr:glycosyltransferase [Paenibacillus validus]MED4601677.1 glycosyltransferase [Paenibacillus validus]MED4606212.1 glycosyltransferase [Paenibacillus validus]